MTRGLTFTVVTHDILGDVFWEVFRKGLFDAGERFAVAVEHLRPGRFSPELMAWLIDQAIAARPDGILATVPDVAAVDAPLRRAIAACIPVIAVNARDPRDDAARIPYLLYIGGDDRRGGAVAAQVTLAHQRPAAALCVDHYVHDHACHRDRWDGYAAAMAAAGVACSRFHSPGDDIEACAAAVAAHLEANPAVDAIVTLGPPGADAAVLALDRLRRSTAVTHVSFDLAPSQLAAIEAGKILATIDSQQYLQGFLGVQSLFLHVCHGFTWRTTC